MLDRMGTPVERLELRSLNTEFKRVKTWLGNPLTEIVATYTAEVFTASSRVVGTKLEAKEQAFKERLSDESFAAYLAREPEPVPTTPMPDASAAPGKVPPPERPDAKLEQYSRDINARAWLAPDFPLSAQQVSAVMDVLQPINKNFERVKEVADLWAQREEGAKFPVRTRCRFSSRSTPGSR